MVFMTNDEEREIVEQTLRTHLGSEEHTDVEWDGKHFRVEPAQSYSTWFDDEFAALRDSSFYVAGVYEAEHGVGVKVGVGSE